MTGQILGHPPSSQHLEHRPQDLIRDAEQGLEILGVLGWQVEEIRNHQEVIVVPPFVEDSFQLVTGLADKTGADLVWDQRPAEMAARIGISAIMRLPLVNAAKTTAASRMLASMKSGD